MKKIACMQILAATLSWAGTAGATLIDRGSGMIYDSAQNLTWLQDTNYAKTSGHDSDGLMSWDDAMAWVQNLTYGGYDDWRLPRLDIFSTAFGFSFIVSEIALGPAPALSMGVCFHPSSACMPSYSPFTNVGSVPFWYGVEDGNTAWAGDAGGILYPIALYPKSEAFQAWAVRDGDVAGVPEPQSLALTILGLACMGYLMRKSAPRTRMIDQP